MREFVKKMLSAEGEVSFGRCAALFWLVFIAGCEVWHLFHAHALVDNGTMISHVGCVSTLYFLGKVPAKIGS